MAGDDFDEQSSDIDLLVEFEEMPFPDRGDAYLGLLTEAEALLGRRVDLVEVSAVRNPYLRQGIESFSPKRKTSVLQATNAFSDLLQCRLGFRVGDFTERKDAPILNFGIFLV